MLYSGIYSILSLPVKIYLPLFTCFYEIWYNPIRHFSVTPYITICPSTETYFGHYLRGAMSAVTGIYLYRLLLNIIIFVLRSFFTLTNSAYHDEMPHAGISAVYKCKQHVPKIYIVQAISCSMHVCIHWL